jgi:lipoprotein-anchoring transpeptidase ErfK/SrfK
LRCYAFSWHIKRALFGEVAMFLRVIAAVAVASLILGFAEARAQSEEAVKQEGSNTETQPNLKISTDAEPAPSIPRSSANVPPRPAKPRAPKPRPVANVAPAPQYDAGSGFSLFRLFRISAVPRTTVAIGGNYKPGTILVHTNERRLYYVMAGGTAIQYGIGVGRVGFTWKGVRTVTEKREWPSWTPPAQMLKRRPDLPRFMAGGPENPLGARALYLGGTLYRIHGTNEYETIGTASSSGCFRMTNEDVIDLYNRVRIGTTVIVR